MLGFRCKPHAGLAVALDYKVFALGKEITRFLSWSWWEYFLPLVFLNIYTLPYIEAEISGALTMLFIYTWHRV